MTRILITSSMLFHADIGNEKGSFLLLLSISFTYFMFHGVDFFESIPIPGCFGLDRNKIYYTCTLAILGYVTEIFFGIHEITSYAI